MATKIDFNAMTASDISNKFELKNSSLKKSDKVYSSSTYYKFPQASPIKAYDFKKFNNEKNQSLITPEKSQVSLKAQFNQANV